MMTHTSFHCFSLSACTLGAVLLTAGCQSNPPDARSTAIESAASRLGRSPAETGTATAARVWNTSTELSMDAAVTDALAHDPSVQAVLARLDAARARVSAAGRLPNPMIDLAIGAPLGGMGVEPYAIMLAQQLNFLWTLERREQIATAELRAATVDASRTLVDAALTARSMYLRAWTSGQLVALVDAQLADAQRLYAAARREVDEGLKPAAELAEPTARIETARAESARAHAQADVDALLLLRAMGTAESALPRLVDPQLDAIVESAQAAQTELDGAHEAALLTAAPDTDLSILAALARVDAAAARLGLGEAERIPAITAATGRERDMTGDSAWMFGLAIELPIFDDGTPAVAQARAELDAARLDAEAARQSSTTAIRSALVQLRSARDVLAASRRRADAVALAADSARRDAAEGLAPPTRSLALSARAAREQSALVDARLQTALALIELDRARLVSRAGAVSSASASAMNATLNAAMDSPQPSPLQATTEDVMP